MKRSVRELRLPEDVTLRLYGGWYFDDGRLTQRANFLLRLLPNYRSRSDGIRLKPELTSSVAAASHRTLYGTYRNSKGPEQKMVDSMIVADSVFLAMRQSTSIIVLSDDADVVPGLITAGRQSGRGSRVIWLRKSTRVSSRNDQLVAQHCDIRTWRI